MKRPKRLSATFVNTVNVPGRYGDGRGGHGLSLLVKPASTDGFSKSWAQRIRLDGKAANVGLGAYPVVTLARARQKALANARTVSEGRDPRDRTSRAPYEPRMMLKVLIYGYATGVFSSRGIARKLEEDVAFRVLGAGNFPSHRTICEFRRRHLADFKRLFVEVVRLAREMGVANFGKLSIDGTKVRANASKRKAMSYGRIVAEERRLAGEIEALLTRARETDAAEDERFGESSRGDELPEELRRREDRLAAIRAARERLEARQREADDARGRKPGSKRNPRGGRPYQREYGEPEASAQDNFTDPESRIMKTSSEGYQQCYNPQVAVEGENQLIVATEVSSNASDQGHLVALLDAVEATHGERPVTVLGDRGDFRIAIRHGGDHSGTRIVLPVPEATRHDSTERLRMGGATRASGS